MIRIAKLEGLQQRVGEELAVGDWVTVDQPMIDKFAEATGDHQWIHVDVARAARELPGGKTIAHGYLTLSLLPRLAPTLMKIEKRKRGVNYGSNKVRFISPVPAGSRRRCCEARCCRCRFTPRTTATPSTCPSSYAFASRSTRGELGVDAHPATTAAIAHSATARFTVRGSRFTIGRACGASGCSSGCRAPGTA